MVLALHAAGHGRTTSQPLEDLTRALDILPKAVWRAAARTVPLPSVAVAFS